MLALYDPLTDTQAYPSYFDEIFLGYYTSEMILKIFGMGFFFSSTAYLRDPWNIMDFVIVITAYIPILFGSGGVNLRGLRSLRVLRPLRTISTVKSLRVIVSTVLQTLPYMRDIIFIAFFSFFIYAIVGLQLMMGVSKNRCIDMNTGIPIYNPDRSENNYQQYCGAWNCSPDLGLSGMKLGCAKMIADPYYGVTNFGTILWSLLNVYQTVTQEGWSDIMFIFQLTWNPTASTIYFISCTFIGNYYFMNLVMAVITTIFEMNSRQSSEDLKKQHKISAEETLIKLINKNKLKIIEMIHAYQCGNTKYTKIQFIRGNLYFYDPNNKKFQKPILKLTKTCWNKFLVHIIGDIFGKDAKFKSSFINDMGKESELGNSTEPLKHQVSSNKVYPSHQISSETGRCSSDDPRLVMLHNKFKKDDVSLVESNVASRRISKNSIQLQNLSPKNGKTPKNNKTPKNGKSLLLGRRSTKDLGKLEVKLGFKVSSVESSMLRSDKLDLKKITETEKFEVVPSLVDLTPLRNNSEKSSTKANPTVNKFVFPSTKAGFKPILLPISTMTRSGVLINSTGFKPYAPSDNNLPSKKIGNIKIKPLGIMKNMRNLGKKQFADIKEVDENEDSFIVKLKKSNSIKKVNNNNNQNQETKYTIESQSKNPKNNPNKQKNLTDENASFYISSDEMSTDEIQASKHFEDSLILQKKNDNKDLSIMNNKDHNSINISKSMFQKKYSNGQVNLSDHSHILPKKSSYLDPEENDNSVFRSRARKKSTFFLKPKLTIKDNHDFDDLDNKDELNNSHEEIVEEYLEDDLEKLVIGKDRFIVDIRYIKIAVDYEGLTTSIDSLDEVMPYYKQNEIQKNEEKEARNRLKLKLDSIYRFGEVENEKAKIKARFDKPRLIFEIPINKNQDRITLYSRRKNKIADLNTNLNEDIQPKDLDTIKNSKVINTFREQSTIGRLLTKRSSKFVTFKSLRINRRIYGQGEADVELIYGLIKNKLDEDHQIDTNEIINTQSNEYFHLDKEFSALKNIDIHDKVMKYRNWSGHEILALSYLIEKMNKVKKGLMINYESIWETGYLGLIQAFRRKVLRFCEGPLFSNLLLLVVLVNTIFLASPGLMSDDSKTTDALQNVNQAFTIIFIIEMGLKLIGMGTINYIRDPMNCVDGSVVLISIVELVFEAQASAFKAFRSIRIFRATRVLRMTKLLRALAFMRFLIGVLAKTFKDFISVLLLMGIFLYIYALLGMQLLGAQLNYPDNVGWDKFRNNFDSLPQALISAYQLMTVENWNNIMYFAERSNAGYFLPLIYLISWIIIGNYILLNLLMALLLAQFGGDEVEEEQELEELEEMDGDIEGDNIETKETVYPPRLHFTITNGKLLGAVSGTIAQSYSINRLDSSRTPSLMIFDDEIQEKTKRFIMFEGNYCEKSLYIFKKSWQIRRTPYWIIKQNWFDYMVLFVIIISSLKLAFDSYIDSSDPSVSAISDISDEIDLALTLFFTAEAVMKCIALGFIMNKGCYLRDPWNVLDFIIVLSGTIDLASTSVNLPFLKILRLLRTLRPLRLVTHNKNMRLIVTALLSSVSGIINVGLVILMITLIFAILGVSLLRGKLGVCDVSNNPNLSRYQINYDTCMWLGYPWMIWDINWENVFHGILSLFVVTTQEGWPDYMFRCTDANDLDVGPVENNYLIIFIYFAVFLLIGAYFLVNLFVGVILYEYSKAEKEEKKKYSYLTDEQEKWIELQKMILRIRPDILINPNNAYQKFWYFMVEANIFEIFIMLCILANMITMGLNYDESLPEYNHQLKNINYVFTSIFIFEMMAKISAYGIKAYFMNNWNKFDSFVVMTSIIELIFDNLQNISLSALRIAPQMGRVFRILRVTRLVRLIKQFPSVQKLLSTLIYSLPSMANVFTLVLLVFYIYAVLAAYLFSDIINGDNIGLYVNFFNFSNSIVTLFRCSTGENWYVIMFDTIHPSQCKNGGSGCGPGEVVAIIFWVSFIVFVQYIVLNLFVMVILNLFSDLMMNENNPLHHFSENIISFKKIWNEHTKKNNGLNLNQKSIINFYMHLPEPLGIFTITYYAYIVLYFAYIGFLKEDSTQYTKDYTKTIASEIMKMNIRMGPNNMISFHEILFATFKRTYGPTGESRKEGKDLIGKIEEKTLEKIDYLTKSLTLNKMANSQTIKQKKIVINPLFQLLFVGMSFRSWQNYTSKVLEFHHQYGDDKEYQTSSGDSMDDDDEEEEDEDDEEYEQNEDYQENDENHEDEEEGSPEAGGSDGEKPSEQEDNVEENGNILPENGLSPLIKFPNQIIPEVNLDNYENEGIIMKPASTKSVKNSVFDFKSAVNEIQ